MTPLAPETTMHHHRARWIVLWTGACVLALAGAFVAGTAVRSPWEEAVGNSTTRPIVTAVVTERSLALDGVALPGKVSLGSTVAVVPSSANGIQVVTANRKAQGEVVHPGEAIADVSGRPLIALPLPFRLYRDLGPGLSGPDVSAVQAALEVLGWYHGPVDGVYGPETAKAVAALYSNADLPAPEAAPEVAVAAVDAERAAVAARAELADAERAVADARSEVDLAERSVASGEAPDAQVSPADALADARDNLASATSRRDAARDAYHEAEQTADAARQAAGTPLPMTEVVRVPASGATVVDVAPVGTELAGDSAAVAHLRSGDASVTFRVGLSAATEFPAGAAVKVTGASDQQGIDGTVESVGPFVSDPTADGDPPGYDVNVLLPESQPFGESQDVSVSPASEANQLRGLTVPLVAIRDDVDGEYVLVGDDTPPPPPRVTITMAGSSDGYAVVSGGGLANGDVVVVSDGT